MDITIRPSRFILENHFDGSKSLTHRFLIASWLANESIMLDNIPGNDDIKATIRFLQAIGKDVVFTSEKSCYIKSSVQQPLEEIKTYVKGSGSTLRFLIPVSLQIAKKAIFTCDDSLIKRPLSVYEEIAKTCNLSIKKVGNDVICSGSMLKDYYEVDGSISSQFITGLIISAIYAKKATTIKINPPFQSKSYVFMSIDVFNQLGFDIDITEDNIIYIHNSQNTQWNSYTIEGDYSTAANYLALACLNGSLVGYNLTENSLQGDRIIVDILKRMGGNIHFSKDSEGLKVYASNNALLEKGVAKQLKATTIDLSECIDLGPILMSVASFAKGTTKFINVDRLKYKESDRLSAMMTNLTKLGVDIKYENGEVFVTGKKDYYNENVSVETFDDHRIAMAMGVFATMNHGSITVLNADCVSKSDPTFFKNLTKACKDGAVTIL